MTSRYDQLGERALWYLQNFDELDLADICASQEAAAEKAQAALARVQALADEHPAGIDTALIHAALDQPAAHDTGPTVAECAADDAKHWNDRQWEADADA